MPKIVPYVDDPQVWKKFIRAQVEGRVVEHAGYGKRGKVKWVPVSAVREPTVHQISPTQAIVERAKAEIERQQEEQSQQNTPYKAKKKSSSSVSKETPNKKHRAHYQSWPTSK